MKSNFHQSPFFLIAILFFLCSCTPSEIRQQAVEKFKTGSGYVVGKSKQVYKKGKQTLGIQDAELPKSSKPMSVSKRVFGELKNGQKVHEFRMINENRVEVSVLDYGATIREIIVPDRAGKMDNISLGFNSVEEYESQSPYFGCIAGRYANRIAKGKFTLDGQDYQLATNNGPNHLHGGNKGFDKRLWAAQPIEAGLGIRLTYRSVDGEEGYPGTLFTTVTYELSEDNQLSVKMEAVCDQPTVVNLTNHTYFNLAGEGHPSILEHLLLLPGSAFLATDKTNIPASIQSVAGTPFDFRHATVIGSRINSPHPQLGYGKGYDHTWVVPQGKDGVGHAATLSDPQSGRVLKLLTDQPGVQFYTGNYLDGSLTGTGGHPYPLRSGLCLEPQLFPDSPNHQNEKGWKSCVLRPGETYRHHSVYHFSVQ
jgi:aldose 1-epimerase